MGQPGGRVGARGGSPGGSGERREEPGGRGGVREVKAERTVSSSGHSEIDNPIKMFRHRCQMSIWFIIFPPSPLLDNTTARLIFQEWSKTECLS